jgi:hypothetical protein
MSAIRLLPSSLDTLSTSEVSSQSTSLVHSPRPALANRVITQSDSAQGGDDYVWSVSVGDDGAFNFYAAPRKNSGNDSASSQWAGYGSAAASGSGWNQQQLSNVVAQYALHASMPMPMTGRFLDVYA